MTATTAEALEAELPKLIKTRTVVHAFHEDDDFWDGNEIYADLETAQQHSAALYASEEYGSATIPAGALEWRRDGNRWDLLDQGAGTNIIVQERIVFGAEIGSPVRVGQIWADTYHGSQGRTVRIVELDGTHATVEVVTEAAKHLRWSEDGSTIGRRTRVQHNAKGLRGYKRVIETTETGAA